MPTIAHLLAPIALLLPAATVDMAAYERSAATGMPSGAPVPVAAIGAESFIVRGLEDDAWQQVRIEQRMIIRIAPRLPGQMVSLPSRPRAQPRFVERKTAKCMPIVSIAGVQPESPDRILLITRNRRLIGASLDKSCHARDFYSGFYVEQNEDGQLCAGRDVIHSRAGANCAVTKLRELVPDTGDDDD